MKPIILYRPSRDLEPEIEIMKKYFATTDSRVGISQQLVIGRYSVLPFYGELEKDLARQGSKLINNLLEHQYIANFDYYHDIPHLTPKTWFSLESVAKDQGPYIIKGKTNSRKNEWKEKMFAVDFPDLVQKYIAATNDTLIGDQGVIIRKYEPLVSFGTSLSGVPHANEWRCFCYGQELLAYGYYWSGAEHQPPHQLPPAALELVKKTAKIVSQHTNFFVIDIAETLRGQWIVIELNEGQMSGLSNVDPEELYANLSKAITQSRP